MMRSSRTGGFYEDTDGLGEGMRELAGERSHTYKIRRRANLLERVEGKKTKPESILAG